MRVMKDVFLQRTVAYNLPQLFELLTDELELYYNGRLISVALGQATYVQRSKYRPLDSKLQRSDICQVIFCFFSVMYP